jgi:hypothetical protein
VLGIQLESNVMRDGLQESMSAINEFVSGGSIENRTNLLSQPLNVCKFTAGRPTPVAERIRRESVFTQQIVKRLGVRQHITDFYPHPR